MSKPTRKSRILGVKFYGEHDRIIKKAQKYFNLESQAAVNRYAIERLGEQMNSANLD